MFSQARKEVMYCSFLELAGLVIKLRGEPVRANHGRSEVTAINFTSNLNTAPELKQEIDRIMGSVHLEE